MLKIGDTLSVPPNGRILPLPFAPNCGIWTQKNRCNKSMQPCIAPIPPPPIPAKKDTPVSSRHFSSLRPNYKNFFIFARSKSIHLFRLPVEKEPHNHKYSLLRFPHTPAREFAKPIPQKNRICGQPPAPRQLHLSRKYRPRSPRGIFPQQVLSGLS